MGSKGYRCRICGKTFKTSYALKQHLKSSHPRYYYGTRIGIPCMVIAVVVLASLFAVYLTSHQPTQTIPKITTSIQTTSQIAPTTTQTIQKTEKTLSLIHI